MKMQMKMDLEPQPLEAEGLETQPITLQEKGQIDSLRRRYHHALSSHAFQSLYLWKEEMGLSILLRPELFAVRCVWQGPNSWFFPCGSGEETGAFLEQGRREPAFHLCYLRQQDVLWLEKNFPGQWAVNRTPEADEYLYDVGGHIGLAGGKYANMRTQVHKVEREYLPEVRELGEDTLDDALEIIRRWEHGHSRFPGCGLRDDQVDERALLLRRELNVTGIVLYLDGQPTAVAAGFPLAPGVFDVAVAKSASTAQGVSYYSKREMFRRSGYGTINLEEDLGIPGLRRMKHGMSPRAIQEIWEAKPL